MAKMFWLTPVQVLSVVKIAPVNCGASTGSALGARNNPAAITAINVSILEVGFILLISFCWGLGLLDTSCYGPRRNLVWIVGPFLTFFSGNGGWKFRKKLKKFLETLQHKGLRGFAAKPSRYCGKFYASIVTGAAQADWGTCRDTA
jgi:hypothetical protein